MRYIQRNENGKIVGHFANFQPGLAEEILLEDDSELIAFINQTGDYTPTPSLEDALLEVFNEQSIELQVQFAPLRATIESELKAGRVHIAKLVIMNQVIPPELEPAREALLSVFPEDVNANP